MRSFGQGASNVAQAQDIIGALESGQRVVYLHGDADVLVDQAAHSVETWAESRIGLPAFNAGKWRASDDDALQAVSTARTVPMMADLRLVWIRDVHLGKARMMEAVLDYLGDPSPTTILLLTGGKFGKVAKGEKNWGTRLSGAVGKVGYVGQFKATDVSPVRFSHERAKALGLHLGRREAETLVELVGTGLSTLEREVEKLSVYVGSTPGGELIRVTGDDLRAVCSALAEESVWELTTGIARRDAELALRALHRLMSDGQDPHYLFSMVAMQLRKMVHAVQLVRNGASDAVVKKQAQVWRELGDIKRIAREMNQPGHPFGQPEKLIEEVARTNRMMNRASAGRGRVLEAWVVRLCAGSPAGR